MSLLLCRPIKTEICRISLFLTSPYKKCTEQKFSLILIFLSLSLFAIRQLIATRWVSFIVSQRSTARLLSLPPLSLKAYQVSFQRHLQFELHAVSCQKHTRSNAHTHAHTCSKKSNWKSWLQVAVKRCLPPSGSLREQRSWYSCNILTVGFKQAPNVWFPVLCLQPISNADFIVPVEIDGTVHQVPCKWAQM